jgi:hypothetical protein
LISARMQDGILEPYDELRARLSRQLEREASSGGLLTRVGQATSSAPLPAFLRRQLLATPGVPRRWAPPLEALAGRGCLSALRFLPGEVPRAPLFAASNPPLGASDADPRGSVTLTLVHHDRDLSVSLNGNGLAGNDAGARAVLDAWLEALPAVRAAAA